MAQKNNSTRIAALNAAIAYRGLVATLHVAMDDIFSTAEKIEKWILKEKRVGLSRVSLDEYHKYVKSTTSPVMDYVTWLGNQEFLTYDEEWDKLEEEYARAAEKGAPPMREWLRKNFKAPKHKSIQMG